MKYWYKYYFIIGCISLSVWLIVSILRISGLLQIMELSSYDILFHFRPDSHKESPVILISETETDMQRYGHPLSDKILSISLEKLISAKVSVIGVDKYRDFPIPPGSQQLEQTLKQHTNIIWIFLALNNNSKPISAPAILKNTDRIGFCDVVDDPDTISRRGLLFLDEGGMTHYAFSLRLALYYLATKQIYPENDQQGYLKLNNSIFLPLQYNTGSYAKADARGYQFLLNYPHLHSGFLTFSIGELLDNKIPNHLLQNKIVLIGGMAPSLGDNVLLPNRKSYYGVELHAHIIDQLIQTALYDVPLIQDWSEFIEYTWLFFWCLLGSITSFCYGSMIRLFLICFGSLIVLFSSAIGSFQYGLWIPLLSAVLAWSLALILGLFCFSCLERAKLEHVNQ